MIECVSCVNHLTLHLLFMALVELLEPLFVVCSTVLNDIIYELSLFTLQSIEIIISYSNRALGRCTLSCVHIDIVWSHLGTHWVPFYCAIYLFLYYSPCIFLLHTVGIYYTRFNERQLRL